MVTVADKLVDVLKKVVAKPKTIAKSKVASLPTCVDIQTKGKLSTVEMERTYWDNKYETLTCQLDTEARVQREGSHLFKFKEIHAHVAVVHLLNDDDEIVKYYKVDAHCRGHVWEKGLSDARPTHVMAVIHKVYSMEEAKSIYNMYDSRKAVERSHHRIQSAMRENSLKLNTGWLRIGKFMSGLDVATSGDKDVVGVIARFKTELKIFDGINPKARYFSSGVTAAALVSFKGSKGSSAIEFWRRFNDKDFITSEVSSFDPVFVLHNTLDERRRDKRMTGNANLKAIAALAAYLCQYSIEGRTEALPMTLDNPQLTFDNFKKMHSA
jgi:hypothetical protein